MSKIPFQRLRIWQKAMQLAGKLYVVTREFPETEKFGLCAQLRRAAVSVPSNIAEGSQRTTDQDFTHYLRIAKSSLAEIETHILLAKERGYLSEEPTKRLLSDMYGLSKMLRACIATMATR